MPLFSPATTFLLTVALALVILNFLVHRLKRSSQVRVTFIPPAGNGSTVVPVGSDPDGVDWPARMDAHISSTNQKLNQLHTRLVRVEQTLSRLHTSVSVSNRISSSDSSSMDETHFNVIPSGFETNAASKESVLIQSTSKNNSKR